MRRRLFFIVLSIVSTVVLTAGCSSSEGSSSTPKPTQEILRKSSIGADWQMYQIRLIIPHGTSYPVVLKMAEGDKVDGYFYLEKGSNVDFGINADTPLYHSTPNASGIVSSDRFSFNASREQGSTYTLQFSSTRQHHAGCRLLRSDAPHQEFVRSIRSPGNEIDAPLVSTSHVYRDLRNDIRIKKVWS